MCLYVCATAASAQTRQEVRGSSLMQPLAQKRADGRWVGSDAFLALAEDEVSPDALFFHKYFGCVGCVADPLSCCVF